MLFDVEQISAKRNQPIRLEFHNPDATPHNFVLAKPGTLEEIGRAANLMAADPKAAKTGQFIPNSDKIIIHTKMLSRKKLKFFVSKHQVNLVHIHIYVLSQVIGQL